MCVFHLTSSPPLCAGVRCAVSLAAHRLIDLCFVNVIPLGVNFGHDIKQYWRLFRYFCAAYPVRSTLMLLSITVAALADGLGIAALLPLMDLVIDSDGAREGLTLYVAQAFALAELELSIGVLLIIIVGLITVKSLLMLLAMTQVGFISAHVVMEQRLRVIRALLEARWQHFVDQRGGNLASAISIEPARAAAAYVSTCRVLAGGFQLLIYSTLSVAISWEVSVAAIVVGIFSLVVLNRFIGTSRRAGRDQTELQKSFMTRLLQGLSGMKPLKAMAREGSLGPLIEAEVRGLNRTQRTIIISREIVSESPEIIRVMAVAAGLYFFLTIWSQPTGDLLILVLLFVRTLQRVNLLQSHYQALAVNQPAFAFLQSTITSAEKAREPLSAGKTPRFDSAISLRDVSFSYGREAILDRAFMVLPVGNFVAIVGASGAGKTTVADLIIGLLQPQQGDVWIDDTPLRDIDVKAWRNMIGYVPQETFLFHDTIMANVTLGNCDISPAQVEHALRRAEVWEFVTTLPEGMDTVVGEQGARLSGGQRQRIAIARALVGEPTLLILDEATTALDPETEAGIVKTIRHLVGRVTVLSISHQPEMKRAADIAYRLVNGRVELESADKPSIVQLVGSCR